MVKKSKKETNKPIAKSGKPIKHQATFETGNDYAKVSLDLKLEALLLEVVRNRPIEDKEVSSRVTKRKLMEIYDSVVEAGFSKEWVEKGMEGTVLRGGGVIEVLDWLCLNLPNENLPENFSQVLKKEENKTRKKYEEVVEEIKENPKVKTTAMKAQVEKPEKQEKLSMKDWILKYSDQCDDEEEDEDEEEGGGGELWGNEGVQKRREKDDFNGNYIQKVAKYRDLEEELKKCMTDHTLGGDQKKIHTQMERLFQEIISLQRHNFFDSRHASIFDSAHELSFLQSIRWKKNEKKEEEEDDDGGSGIMGMFEVNEDEEREEKGEQETEVEESHDVRNLDYTRKQWSGKSPKQFLHDWVSKKAKGASLSYYKIDLGRGLWKNRCRLTRPPKQGESIEVVPKQACTNIKDSEHLASTLVLYRLCKMQDIQNLLPPPYKDLWMEWKREEEMVVVKAVEMSNKPRDDFIDKLYTKITDDKNKDGDDDNDQKEEEEEEEEEVEDGSDDDDDWENYKFDELKEVVDLKIENKEAKTNKSKHDAYKLMAKNRKNTSYLNLLKERQELPVFKQKAKIMNMFKDNNVFIVSGETGSGKSTQVPQFILEHLVASSPCDQSLIVCTQPRRISATSLARRVCMEMGEELGPGGGTSLCGYQIRSESQKTSKTRLLYCTVGVLLRKLQQDASMGDVACVVVDEVHERDLNTDVLLIHLLNLLVNPSRKNIKVVLMSATADVDRFSSYFGNCASVCVEGKLYPVKNLYLEDLIEASGFQLELDSFYSLPYDLLVEEQSTTVQVTGRAGMTSQQQVTWSKQDIFSVDKSNLNPDQYSLRTRNVMTRLNHDVINVDLIIEAVKFMHSSAGGGDNDAWGRGMAGAILIFLPGLSMIEVVKEAMLADDVCGDVDRFLILPLHSILSTQQQSLVFSPSAKRKVILSTNIAETGLTIPDVVYVFDCGREKQVRYLESNRMSQLRQVWISQASGKQRSGRAGRVRSGTCIRLYSKETFNSMKAQSVPEMKRMPLQGLCLHVMKSYRDHPSTFLLKALDPPTLASVNVAMNILEEVGACEGCTLTPLGEHLSALPMDARMGKMLLYSAVIGCLKEACIMVACMTEKSPFMSKLESSSSSSSSSLPKTPFNFHNSDQLATFEAVNRWIGMDRRGDRMDYARRNNLKTDVLRDIESTSKEYHNLIESTSLWDAKMVGLLKQNQILANHFKAPPKSTNQQPTPSTSRGTIKLLKAILLAGLYPNVGWISELKDGKKKLMNKGDVCEVVVDGKDSLKIHPSSVNRTLDVCGTWIAFQDKEMLNNRPLIANTTTIETVAMLLFGGNIVVQHQQQLLNIDKYITLKAPAKVGVLFKELRMMLDAFLRHKLHKNNNNNKNNNKANRDLTTLNDEKLLVLILQILTN